MSAKHFNLSTVIDKNKVDSTNAFLLLIEVHVINPESGVEDAVVRFCKNSENIEFEGNTFTAANFDLQLENEVGKEPSMTLTAQDQTRALGQYLDAYDGLTDSKLRMIVVNSASLDAPAEMDETVLIVHGSTSNYVVELSLGVESAVSVRFPNYRQNKDFCAWKYKGPRCKYAGALATCDYSLNGPNGCKAHDNAINFGGFPGISELF